jgi:hypothetical protein
MGGIAIPRMAGMGGMGMASVGFHAKSAPRIATEATDSSTDIGPGRVSKTRSRTRREESPPTVSGVTDVPATGKAAIDWAQHLAGLKMEEHLRDPDVTRTIAGRRFRNIDGAWVDQGLTDSTPLLQLRVLGTAYFRLLARHPELSPIFALGNQVTWISPSGTALRIDGQGADDVLDASLDRLFDEPS